MGTINEGRPSYLYPHTTRLVLNVDILYPVGSIYMTTSLINPESLFGGKWKRIKGKFLLGVDEEKDGTTDEKKPMINTGGSIGGNESVTLDLENIPPHKHQIKTNNDDWNNSSGGGNFGTTHDGASGWANNNWYTENTGGSSGATQPFLIYPPYYTVYIWEREA